MKAEAFILLGASAATTAIVQPLIASAHVHAPHVPLAGVAIGTVVLGAVAGIVFDDLWARFLNIESNSIAVFCGTVLLTVLVSSVAAFAGIGNFEAIKWIGIGLLALIIGVIALLVHLKQRGAGYDQY